MATKLKIVTTAFSYERGLSHVVPSYDRRNICDDYRVKYSLGRVNLARCGNWQTL
jgi:hypothetical protein